jgi:ribosomal protein L11 methyltransferase
VPAGAVEAFWGALAEGALSVSAFEEQDEGAGLWRIELLHQGPPDRPGLEAQVAAITAARGLAPVALTCEPVPPVDWLVEVARRFPPTRIGRFFIHGQSHAEPPPEGTIPLRIEAGSLSGVPRVRSGERRSTHNPRKNAARGVL